MKSVKVRYFASLKELAGVDSEILDTASVTYRDLYSELSQKYKFPLPANMIQVAINDSFSSLDKNIETSVTVVFIPPVAGG